METTALGLNPVAAGAVAAPARPAVACSRRVYMWRRLLLAVVLVAMIWGVCWSVWSLGGFVGSRLVAPALGTAPVPAAEAVSQPGT